SSQFASATKVSRFALANGQTQTVYTTGPLTLTARCTISPAGDTAEILIATTQDNAAFDAADNDPDLDGADPEAGRQFVFATGPTGTPAFARVADGFAIAPDGSEIRGASLYAGVNVLGFTSQCVFGGQINSS